MNKQALDNITRVFAQTLRSEKINKMDAAAIAGALLCAVIEEIAEDDQDAAVELLLAVAFPTLLEAAGVKAVVTSHDVADGLEGDEDDLPPAGTTLQ